MERRQEDTEDKLWTWLECMAIILSCANLNLTFALLSTCVDWYEGSLPQPQVVLQELLGILDPSRNHQHFYFRNIAEVRNIQATPVSARCLLANHYVVYPLAG